MRVFWTPDAEQQLEAILRGASDSANIARAARELDRSLALARSEFGESRYDRVRIAFVRPLGIQFEVLDDLETVIVFDVWRIDRPKA